MENTNKLLKEPLETFEKRLFMYQPWEIIGAIFSYFALALKDANQEKLEEFYSQFKVGVEDAIEYGEMNTFFRPK